jgi:DNA-binding response OmpR family regulator
MASHPRILIVDDEKPDALQMGEALAGHGYVVKVTRSPLRALELVKQWSPQVAVLDIQMQEMNGVALSQKLKALLGDPFIIFVTGDTSAKTHDLCLSAGDEYIVKPYTPNDLYLRIKNKLDRQERDERRQVLSQPRRLQPGRFAPQDSRLWAALAAGKGEAVARDTLMKKVWGEEEAVMANALDRAIGRLREQIEPDPSHPIIIITVRNVGYRIDVGALRQVKRAEQERQEREEA